MNEVELLYFCVVRIVLCAVCIVAIVSIISMNYWRDLARRAVVELANNCKRLKEDVEEYSFEKQKKINMEAYKSAKKTNKRLAKEVKKRSEDVISGKYII